VRSETVTRSLCIFSLDARFLLAAGGLIGQLCPNIKITEDHGSLTQMSQTLVLSYFYGPFGTRRAETAALGLSLQLLTEASLNREEDAYLNV